MDKYETNARELLGKLTKEEKIALVQGCDFMYTNPVPRLDIPSMRMSDGPHGLRVQAEGGDNGITNSLPSTSFPTAVTSASSWNPENTYRMGKAMGEEARHYGIDCILGPGLNIKRNPLGGRNFEYFSEDPLVAGEMAASAVEGIQSTGVMATLKHFALNNSENYRFNGNSIADMRAIREIYLRGFERAVKKGKPYAVMCAYNQVNGTYASENGWLLTDVLRREWGFDGFTMSDWGATHDRVKGIVAGLDLEMPGETHICRKWISDALENGTLDEKDLDTAVLRILKAVEKAPKVKGEPCDVDAHDVIAEEIALDSAVLMKNDGILPLSKDRKYFVAGELFEKMRYQGSGSSMINPTKLTSPKKAFEDVKIDFSYAPGYRDYEEKPNENLINEAIKKCGDTKDVLLFIGLTDYVESEGCDREHMRLPDNQLALVDAFLKAGKDIVVVLFGGSPIEMPFKDDVKAILNMYLPGQAGGRATRKLLFGEANPSGRLAETYPASYDDVPFGREFSKSRREIYLESVFVGYRHYVGKGKPVLFPFGHGLSYSEFTKKLVSVKDKGDLLGISVEIENISKVDGADVIQIYVSKKDSKIFRPLRELKAFRKVYLKAGEKKLVDLEIEKKDLESWNIEDDRFELEEGTYSIELCENAEKLIEAVDLVLEGTSFEGVYDKETMKVYSGDISRVDVSDFERMSGLKVPPIPARYPLDIESRFSDLRHGILGRFIHWIVIGVSTSIATKGKKDTEAEKENSLKGKYFMRRIMESNSFITMSMSAGKSCPFNVAEMFVEFGNGHLFRGLRKVMKGIKAPTLPKDSDPGKGRK